MLLCLLLPLVMSEVAFAQTAAEPATLKIDVARASPGGVHIYAPEKWGLLHVNVTNAGEQPRHVLVATYFDVEPTLQYARRLRVPANTALHASVPVLIPKVDAKDGRQLNYHSLIFDVDGPREVLMKSDSGALLQDGALLVNFDRRISGFIDDPDAESENSGTEAYELLVACRIAQHLDRRVGKASSEGLPFDEQSLDALTNLVITGNRLLKDEAGLAAIRRWMFNGGRVWLMADSTDPRVCELLLGDEASLHVVDRAELNSVRVDLEVDPSLKISKAPAQTIEHEVPVNLLRVIASGFEVRARVNGWPAALSRPFGHGSLLITTLGPRGWMTPRKSDPTATGSKKPNPETTSRFEIITETNSIIHDFIVIRPEELISADVLAAATGDFIGYSIPSRGLIFGILLSFVGAIGVAGVWLWKRQRLERLGWIVPVLGVTSAALLIGIGRSNRNEISATAATIQVLQGIPGSDDSVVQGLLATYHPDGAQTAFKGDAGGRLVPKMTGLSGTTRRMVWTDMGQWHWENVPQPSGQVTVPFTASSQSGEPTEVRATLGPNGLSGRISQLPNGFADPVLVTRVGRIGMNLKPNGDFVATTADVFGRDQYLAAQLLNDEQSRRRQILQKLLQHPLRRDYPAQPVVMGWTGTRETGIAAGDEFKTVGSALNILPLKLERPANGSEFVIPSPLLPYRSTYRPDGKPSSQVFDHRTNEWRDSAIFSTVWLRFQIPPELLPITPQRAEVSIQVSGPVGKLELLGMKGDRVSSLDTQMDPVGTVTLEVTDRSMLAVAEDGALKLGLNIGDKSRPELTQSGGADGKANYWRIDGLGLTLWGKAEQ